MIPKGWKLKNLEEIGEFKNGINKSKEDFGFGIPFINLMDVFGNSVLQHKDYGLVNATRGEIKNYSLVKGDVLFIRSSVKPEGVGLTCLVDKTLDNIVYSGFIIRFRPLITLEHSFLRYCFYEEGFRRELLSHSTISANTNINQQSLNKLTLLLPPLSEQRKIAEILGTWDNAIESLEQLITAKRKLKQGLMQQLLTGKKRFKGFEDSEWIDYKLSEISTVTMGTSPKSENYNSEGQGLPLLQGNADIKNRYSSPRIWTTDVTKECYPDDILMSVRAPVGTISLSLHHACIGRGIASIRFKEDKTNQSYLYQLLLFFEPCWTKLSQGSTFDSVNSNDIKSCIFKLSSLIDEQRKIASVLSTIDTEISTLETQLTIYKLQKCGLMQQLLTGKKRVKVPAQITT